MDDFRRHHVGVRHGRNCPCCREARGRGGKAIENRLARARAHAADAREVAEALLDPDDGSGSRD